MIGIRATLEQAAYSPTNDPIGRSIYMGPSGYPRDGSVTGVIVGHGAGGNCQDVWSGASTNLKTILQSVAQERPTIACDFGGDLWGNDTNIAQVNDAYNYLVTTYGARSGRVLLMGRSMGHLAVANWARQHASLSTGIAVFAGVSDLNNIHSQSGSSASIDAAYGGAYTDAAYGSAHNPNIYASNGDLNTIPWRNYYATDDATVPPATVLTLASKITNGQAISMGTGGHTDAPLANVNLDELLDWLDSQAND